MNDPLEVSVRELPQPANGKPVAPFRLPARFVATAIALTLCFSWTLFGLLRYALQSGLYSHIVLIPCISAFLIHLQRKQLPPVSAPNRALTAALLLSGLALSAAYGFAVVAGRALTQTDSLALTTTAYLLGLGGICSLFFGQPLLRSIAFPLGFLVFMVPFPEFSLHAIEAFLQHSSAAVACILFKLTGTPVLQENLVIFLPGITLEVAPECSGIHSSLVLFITSLLAGYLFLRTPRKRAILALAVIPLAVLRNALRIYTIGELCVHVSPDMIDSYIHRHGGPLFFVLSLIPFFLILLLLLRSDRLAPKAAATSAVQT